MKPVSLKRIAAMAAALIAFGLASTAYAQYVWVDEKGVKQYSDMPPPSSVPQNRILKEPGGTSRSSSQASSETVEKNEKSAATTTAPTADKAKAPMTTREKNADFQKRKAEQAEKEKKAADQEKQAADKVQNCERAREYSRSLEAGDRIGRTDKSGERSYLTDEQRAKEARDTRRVLDDCK